MTAPTTPSDLARVCWWTVRIRTLLHMPLRTLPSRHWERDDGGSGEPEIMMMTLRGSGGCTYLGLRTAVGMSAARAISTALRVCRGMLIRYV